MRDEAWRNLLVLSVLPAALLVVDRVTPRRATDLGAQVTWAAGHPPRAPLSLAQLAPLDSSHWPGFSDGFQVSVVGRFPSPGEAHAAATRVSDLLAASAEHYAQPEHAEARARLLDAAQPAPLPPPEAIRLAQVGITGLAAGVGWPGAAEHATRAPLVLGDLLLVCGLKGDFAGRRAHPLGSYFRALGADVWTEGDPATPPFATDLTCRTRSPDHSAGLAATLNAYVHGRRADQPPPWAPQTNPEVTGLHGGWVRAQGTRLELGDLRWRRIGPGLWSLLTYLRSQGCADLKLELVERPPT